MVIYFGSTGKRKQTVGSKENGVQLLANFPSSQFCFAMGLACTQLPASYDPKVLSVP